MTKNEKSPEKRHVILEDLDRYEIDQESRRKKLSLLDLVRPGRQSGVMHWHRLFSFARPYVRKIIISLIITWVAASLMGAKLWFINEGVQPIIDPEQVVKEEKEDPDVISRVKDRVFGLFSSDDEEEEAPPEAEAPSEFDPSLAREKLALLIVIFTLVIIIEQTLNYFQSILIRSAGHSITMDIRNALFAKVMSFSLRFHNKNHSGKLVSRITGDINVFGTFFTNTAVEMIRDTTQFVVCVIALAWLGGWQIFVLSACVCGIFLPVQAIARKIRRRDKQILRSRSLIYSQLTEALSGQKIVKAFNTEEYEYDRFRDIGKTTYRNTMKSARLRSRTAPIVEVLGFLAVAVLMWYGGTKVIAGAQLKDDITESAIEVAVRLEQVVAKAEEAGGSLLNDPALLQLLGPGGADQGAVAEQVRRLLKESLPPGPSDWLVRLEAEFEDGRKSDFSISLEDGRIIPGWNGGIRSGFENRDGRLLVTGAGSRPGNPALKALVSGTVTGEYIDLLSDSLASGGLGIFSTESGASLLQAAAWKERKPDENEIKAAREWINDRESTYVIEKDQNLLAACHYLPRTDGSLMIVLLKRGDYWTFGGFATIAMALVYLIATMRRLARCNNNVQAALASADRVASLLYSDPEIVDAPDSRDIQSLEKEIRFENVSYRYDPTIPVLTDVTFTASKGQIIAIVGPSGAGKTTLIDLIPRFFDIDAGSITIDGIDIRKLKVGSLRRQIGIVSQETFLFSGTVGMNIAYGSPNASEEEIIAAATAANAHEFIMEMESGYDTHIGERGVALSGGQRQRIAIARAILRNPPILILDEATSALDSKSETKVQEALSRLMQGRTTFVIAHRLSTIRNADMILVFTNTRLVETGTHEELISSNGVYTHLHELQTQWPRNG